VSPEAAARSRDKAAMRACLARAGVAQPAFEEVADRAAGRRFAARHGYPIIVKPVDGSGSMNTRLVSTGGELDDHVELLLGAPSYKLGVRACGRVLCEEYVRGELYSVETITSAPGQHVVLGITDRILGGAPNFVELGGSFPAQPPDGGGAVRTVLAALDAVGYDFGPAHTELVATERGWQIIEINARLVGGYVPAMIDATLGRDIMLDVVKLHLGEPIAPFGPPHGVASLRAMHVPTAGTITAIEPSARRGTANVLLYRINRRPGDRVRPVADNHDRLGSLVVWSETDSTSRRLADEILRETRFAVA
jgi:argininosuccinate lyase